jgi:hypothetical protein
MKCTHVRYLKVDALLYKAVTARLTLISSLEWSSPVLAKKWVTDNMSWKSIKIVM